MSQEEEPKGPSGEASVPRSLSREPRLESLPSRHRAAELPYSPPAGPGLRALWPPPSRLTLGRAAGLHGALGTFTARQRERLQGCLLLFHRSQIGENFPISELPELLVPVILQEFVHAPCEFQGYLRGACGGQARSGPASSRGREEFCGSDGFGL